MSDAATFEYIGGPKLSNQDAPTLAATCERIAEKKGRLSSRELEQELIAASRPKTSPTHHLFEWDQAKGHALYLQHRARELIMSLRIVWEDAPKDPVRALPVVITQGKRGPFPMQRVLTDRDLTTALVEQAQLEAAQWARRHETLRRVVGLRAVFKAIDSMKGKAKKSAAPILAEGAP